MNDVKLVLGTMTFGESVFLPDVGTFINEFLDAGYDELDTAYVYNEGNCERMLGEVLPALNRPYKIATKVNPRISGEAMADLHAQGKFKELGLSNFPAWMVADVWHICDEHGWVKPTVFEGIYNPLTRKAEIELNDCLNAFGMRFYAYNPLAGGLLTGRYAQFEDAPTDGRFTHRPNYQKRYWKKSYFDAVSIIREAAEKYDITCIEAVYRWLSYHSMLDGSRGDAIIIGASRLNHLKQNLETVKAGPLPEEVVKAFEQAWKVTKGDSPEYFTLYKGKGSVGGEKK